MDIEDTDKYVVSKLLSKLLFFFCYLSTSPHLPGTPCSPLASDKSLIISFAQNHCTLLKKCPCILYTTRNLNQSVFGSPVTRSGLLQSALLFSSVLVQISCRTPIPGRQTSDFKATFFVPQRFKTMYQSGNHTVSRSISNLLFYIFSTINNADSITGGKSLYCGLLAPCFTIKCLH